MGLRVARAAERLILDRGSLVLTRKLGEAIEIGDDVEVQVVAIRGGGPGGSGQVKLLVRAPRDWPVHRREIAEKIRRNDRSDAEILAEIDEEARRA
jgi:carbon storage regulator